MAKSGFKKVGILAMIAGAVLSVVAASYAVLIRAIALSLIRPQRKPDYETEIVDVDFEEGTITLSKSAEAEVPGKYGLYFSDDQGYLRYGEILRSTANSVTRVLEDIVHGDPREGAQARVMSWYYLHPHEVSVNSRETHIPGPIGDLPAWLFPVEGSSRWAVLVHGRGVTRSETLRAVPLLNELGYNCLAVSWRNDGDGPVSSDGYYHLGKDEWEDLEAAVSYVKDHGAQEIIISAWSMGGAITGQFLLNSVHAESIKAVIMDSPVLDWESVLSYQSEAMGIPEPVRASAKAVIATEFAGLLTGQSEAIDVDELSLLRHADSLLTPLLILHSDDDGFVPSHASREMEAVRPDLVTLVSFDTARHVRLWNYDQERWETAVRSWLEIHGA